MRSQTARTAHSLEDHEIRSLVEGRHGNPFRILGPHRVTLHDEASVLIHAFLPEATSVEVLVDTTGGSKTIPMSRVGADGLFEAAVPGAEIPRYRLRAIDDEHSWVFEDPYGFPWLLGELDLHLLSEGTHARSFEKLGAHLREIDGVAGVHFAVWAPNAERVSVVGSFNDWDGRRHPMRRLSGTGTWELFLPGLAEGDLYKFEIRTKTGQLNLKSDPHALRCQFRPETASVVHDVDRYEWGDHEWMEARRSWDWQASPMSTYEVHLGSWARDGDRFLTYRELAPRLADYALDMGFTHLELLPVLEHPFDASWGYQTLGYFAPTSRFGTPDDFMYFVDHCHQRGLGVILDWVPAHFPKDDHGLRLFDGTHLYEHADPRQGEHRDWGTMIFNYGRNEVRNFLLSSAFFWLEKYHLDGLRVDAVASMLYLDYSRESGEWIPNEFGGNENLDAVDFLKELNRICHRDFPGAVTIAEESTAWPGVSRPIYLGGLGFTMKWNMGWMNDTLSYFKLDPVFRKYHHHNLTFSLVYAFSENFVLPLSHDEVVHGKGSLLGRMPGDTWQQFANLRLLLGYQGAHPGKMLLFMGGEFGMGREWSEARSIDWHLLDSDWHRGVQRFTRDLNRLYRDEPALHELDFSPEGFEWIDCQDWESSIIAFARRGRRPDEQVVVVINFTPPPRLDYRLGVPGPGFYREVLNSDAVDYCGSGMGNFGGVHAEATESHGRPDSVRLTLPPLGMLILKRERGS